MPDFFLNRLVKKYGFNADKISGESLKKLTEEILKMNAQNVSENILNTSDKKFKRSLSDKFKKLNMPNVNELLLKNKTQIMKLQENGKIINQTLRDRLNESFKEILENPDYYRKNWKLKGSLKNKAFTDLQNSIKNTFEDYTKKNPKYGVPSNIKNIATTELRTVTNNLQFEFMNQMQFKNDDMEIIKIWKHNGRLSKKPREHHREIDGVSIAMNENFVMFDKKNKTTIETPHPHWEGLDLENKIGCNCELRYEFKKREPGFGIYG